MSSLIIIFKESMQRRLSKGHQENQTFTQLRLASLLKARLSGFHQRTLQ